MSGIFISYRRQDSDAYSGRLYDRLTNHFGKDQVFMDIDMEPGVDFVELINEKVASCDVLIAVIGRNWLTITGSEGHRRLDNPDDFVRLEIAAALDRKIPVIPALVGGTTMPRADDLPEVLSRLARRQAIEISHTRFHLDVEPLIKSLERILASEKEKGSKKAGAGVAKETTESRQQAFETPLTSKVSLNPDPDLIVMEPQTGLMWTRRDNGKDIQWHDAIEYANNLSLGGHRDWRLPSIEELDELYDPQTGGKYNIRQPFELTGRLVWSSTKEGSDFAWGFNFHFGSRDRGRLIYFFRRRALCVRRSGG